MDWPTFPSQEQNHRAPIRWQHRQNRERPTCTERNESLLESADGSMATVATRREKNICLIRNTTNLLDSDRPSHGRPLHSKCRPSVPSALAFPSFRVMLAGESKEMSTKTNQKRGSYKPAAVQALVIEGRKFGNSMRQIARDFGLDRSTV